MNTTILILFAIAFIAIVVACVIINNDGLFCGLFDLTAGIMVISASFVGIVKLLFALIF